MVTAAMRWAAEMLGREGANPSRTLLMGLMAILAVAVPQYEAYAIEPSNCEQAAANAERDAGMPPGLLQAIGRVESGRSVDGQLIGWPLSVNAGGVSRQFATYEDAAAFVQDQSLSGQRFIDVGCFQIDLFYHPEAFGDRDDGFRPQENATAASRILQNLYARAGSWDQAIALYHSADPTRGIPYLKAVLRSWAAGHKSGLQIVDLPRSSVSDPFTVVVFKRVSTVTVWGPITGTQDHLARSRAKLPTIITP